MHIYIYIHIYIYTYTPIYDLSVLFMQDQAIDRLHRLGQRRPVRALRFVAERTVEVGARGEGLPRPPKGSKN